MTLLDQAPGTSADESPAAHADQSREESSRGIQHSRVNVAQVERALSIAIGSIVIAKGLSRLSVPALLIAGAGAMLFNRGVTGHCPLYSKMGVDTAND